MKNILFIILLDAAFNCGWLTGLAGYSWTKWIAAPAFCFLIGAAVRMFWMKPLKEPAMESKDGGRMRNLPKKVRKELSANESLNRWFLQCLNEIHKRHGIKLIILRDGNNIMRRLKILNVASDADGLILEVEK
jgi:hypothetical protein